MAVEERLFLGIKQVTKETFSALDDSEKVGYLWFVRNEDPEHLEIYLGTRLYGETNSDEYIDEIAQKIASAVGLTSGLTLPDGFEYESVIAAFDDKQDVIDDLDVIRSGATLGLTSVQEETDPTVPAWAKEANKPTYTAEEVGALPSSTTIPTKTSELINDSGFVSAVTVYEQGENITISGNVISAKDTTYTASDFDVKDLSDSDDLRSTWSGKQDAIDDLDEIRSGATLGLTSVQEEVDPTVPAWAKQPNKPSYTAEEVGALPSSTTIPTKVSDLTNDSGFITGYTETDPTVPAWAKTPNKPTYTAQEVGALPSSTTIPAKTSDLTNDSGFITGYTESDPTVPSWAKQPNKPTYTAQEVGALSSATTIPSKTSDLTNDSGFITGYTETDPTVPSWAKQPSKPSYTASEVGALPSSTTIPSKTSDLTNDSGFISGYTETDPTVPSWAKQPNKPSYTAEEVGAIPSSTTIPTKTSDLTNDSGFITGYTETDPTVHAWAKEANKPTYAVSEISGLTDALNSKSNTGHTHDQYSLTGHTHTAQEVGALSSATTIPSKTSDLTNDSGFITGYTETDPTVPSWAKQPSKPSYTASEVGALPSSTTIPSKTSDLTNDSGFITGYTETDPTVPAWAKTTNKPTYTAAEVGALSSATTIPSKTSELTNDSGFITGITTPVDSAITAYSAVTSVSATTSVSAETSVSATTSVSADTSTSATTAFSAETSVSATTAVSAVTSFSAETSNAVKHTDTGQLGGTVFPILASSSSNPNNGSHSVLYATNININPVTNSIAIGSGTTANGNYAFAEGYHNEAAGNNSFAGGDECHALSSDTFAFGEGLRADYNNMFVVGRYNKDGESNGTTDGVNWEHLFDVGYGMRHDVSNIQKETIFKVIGKWKYENYQHYIWSHVYFNDLNCNIIWADSYNHNNADYSEYLEWLDGNPNGEDRVGKFVTLKGNKIDIANADDDVIGVVSSTPGIIGNCSENNWHDKYLKDVYGRYIQPDGSDNQTVVVEGRNAYVLNPEYNSESEYVPRSKRKEWAVIGFIGQFIVDDDGTCVPGRRCVVTDGGIATLSPTNKVGYRVMERIDNTHIRIIASFL